MHGGIVLPKVGFSFIALVRDVATLPTSSLEWGWILSGIWFANQDTFMIHTVRLEQLLLAIALLQSIRFLAPMAFLCNCSLYVFNLMGSRDGNIPWGIVRVGSSRSCCILNHSTELAPLGLSDVLLTSRLIDTGTYRALVLGLDIQVLILLSHVLPAAIFLVLSQHTTNLTLWK